MIDTFGARLDSYGRRHPRLMLWATIALAVVTTLVVIYNSTETEVIYKAF
jgi:hypothetical protein